MLQVKNLSDIAPVVLGATGFKAIEWIQKKQIYGNELEIKWFYWTFIESNWK